MELILTTSQKLALSHKMMLSAEILQMSSQELVDYLKNLSVENPVVDLEFKDSDENKDNFRVLKKKLEWLESSDEQNKTYYSQDKEDENDDWKFKQTDDETLEEYLLSQANVLNIDKKTLYIIHYIIECINENGYLAEEIETIAKGLHIDVKTAQDALNIVQNFEPSGVGARNLKECLLIQLKKMDNIPKYVETIVSEYLDELSKNHIPVIAKKLKLSIDDVIKAKEIITKLNPKPGNCFFTDKTLEFITPDVIVYKENGKFKVVLDDRFFPKVHINSYYLNLVSQSDTPETKSYVSKKVAQAQWAIKCIEKRNNTLTRTVESILENQLDFFNNGQGHLQPLRLIDVSQALELHESTISRAIKDKYLQCSWGIFPLNYFFSAAIPTKNSNAAVSADSVKEKIKLIISEENKTCPLSDREITQKLVDSGVTISRRTVAKYRESMGIPGTSGRKEF